MSPLSPLRIILLGSISWIILGFGLYCLWEGIKRANTPTYVESVQLRESDDLNVNDTPNSINANPAQPLVLNETTTAVDNPGKAWPYLLCGTILTMWSFLGFLPTNFLLSSGSDPIPIVTKAKQLQVNSPDGSRIALNLYEHASAPTLLFTHGWSLDSSAWNYAIDRFQGTYRMATWDLPGLGDSSAPSDNLYTMERLANDLHVVIQTIDNGKPIILVGHSIGGMIAQTLLKMQPHEPQIQGVALIHTTYTDPLKTMLGSSLWTSIKHALIVPLNKLIIVIGPVVYLSNWQSYLNGSLNIASRFSSFTGRQSHQQLNYASLLSAKAWPPHIARGNLAMMQFDAQDSLPHSKLPLLVIAGRHDRVTKPVASERITELADLPKPIYTDGGHLSIWEFHKHVLDSLEMFVAEVTSQSAAATESV